MTDRHAYKATQMVSIFTWHPVLIKVPARYKRIGTNRRHYFGLHHWSRMFVQTQQRNRCVLEDRWKLSTMWTRFEKLIPTGRKKQFTNSEHPREYYCLLRRAVRWTISLDIILRGSCSFTKISELVYPQSLKNLLSERSLLFACLPACQSRWLFDPILCQSEMNQWLAYNWEKTDPWSSLENSQTRLYRNKWRNFYRIF